MGSFELSTLSHPDRHSWVRGKMPLDPALLLIALALFYSRLPLQQTFKKAHTMIKSRFVITLLLLLLAGSNGIMAQDAATEQPVSITRDGIEIYGSLMVPNIDDPMPVALIIAGSGPTDRNGNNPMMTNNALKLVAEGLAEQGIASVRYDKRGVAESLYEGLDESTLRFEHYIEDANAWLEHLGEDERFSSRWVIGHSEGSLIGMVAAHQANADGFVSLAGVGEPADLTLKRQLSAQPEPFRGQMMEMIDQLKAGELLGEVDPMFNTLFRPSVQPYLISWFAYDPTEWIAKLDGPVLIVQGTTDLQVTVEDANTLHAAQPDAELVIIEGMNHVLKQAPLERGANLATYNQGDAPLAGGLVEAMVGLIQD